MKAVRVIAFSLLSCTCFLSAQKQNPPLDCAAVTSDVADQITKAKADTTLTSALKLQRITDLIININNFSACAEAETTVAKAVAAKRTDVQVGATAGTSGTTTAVSSASKTSFLGLALENGTTTQTTSGTSSTVSINPWKFVESLANDLHQTIDPGSPESVALRKFSLSVTLNSGNTTNSKQTSLTGASGASGATGASGASGTNGSSGGGGATNITPATLITDLKEVSDFTVHFDVYNNRDPMSSGAAKKIRQSSLHVPANLFTAADTIGQFLSSDVAAEAQTLLNFTGDIPTELKRFMAVEEQKLAANQLISYTKSFQQAASALIAQNTALYKSLANSPVLSIEYSLDRQPMVQATASGSTTTTGPLMNTPDLHTGRLIQAFGHFTFNESVTFFGQETPAMHGVFRDYQLGGKVDIPFAGITNLIDKGTLELSGLFVDLHQMPIGINLMVNGVSVTQPGKIGFFQAKYNIPIPSSNGVQVPISITYSNRTDLLKNDTTVQGGIGITWDMSKLIAAKQGPSQ